MENNPLPDAALAELDRMAVIASRGGLASLVDQETYRSELAHAYPALRQRLLYAESRLAEAEADRARLEWAWANPDKFTDAQRSTPPNRTGRQQIDAARGTK